MNDLVADVQKYIDNSVSSLFTAFCSNSLTQADMIEIQKVERALAELITNKVAKETARDVQHYVQGKYGV